ncbi:hypothetical protein BaRGS_00030270 [Batillaria attramentaria]|uniref:Uncharacterized protein n=1 Tax=Batillaria attramentaria TaxID=370345 RepID=A0ABD0JUZ5_9CAEN
MVGQQDTPSSSQASVPGMFTIRACTPSHGTTGWENVLHRLSETTEGFKLGFFGCWFILVLFFKRTVAVVQSMEVRDVKAWKYGMSKHGSTGCQSMEVRDVKAWKYGMSKPHHAEQTVGGGGLFGFPIAQWLFLHCDNAALKAAGHRYTPSVSGSGRGEGGLLLLTEPLFKRKVGITCTCTGKTMAQSAVGTALPRERNLLVSHK